MVIDCSWACDQCTKLCRKYRSARKDIETIKSLAKGSIPNEGWLKNLSYSQAMVVCLGAGPWKIQRRKRIQEFALERLGDKDLFYLYKCKKTWYPLSWQNDILSKIVFNLHERNIKFLTLCKKLKFKKFPIADFYTGICGVPIGTKVISLFLRDALDLPRFPIDRWVRRFLKEHSLPVDEEFMVNLCKMAGINASDFNRYIVNQNFSGNAII